MPSLVSNMRDEMTRFVTRVADLVRKECPTTMLQDDMTIARLMVYDQSIEESKLKRMTRNMKRSGSSEQGQPRLQNRAQTQKILGVIR